VSGFFEGAPDLAVEVLSPTDTQSEVLEKVDEWLSSGASSVWVIEPRTRSIVIHRVGKVILRYREGDRIDNEPLLPDFTLDLAAFFRMP
jgi:Uma2 family endonuclease